MEIDLERFISDEQFIQCPPMPVDDFIRLCNDCGLQIHREDLEMLEREGLFYPLIRVQFPKYIQKIRRLDDKYQILGVLEPSESWDGETEEAYGHFWFAKDVVEEFYREGLLWRPQDSSFEPWENFLGKDLQDKRIESYYSPFQIYPLRALWESTRISLSLISWAFLDEAVRQRRALEMAELGRQFKEVWTGPGSRFDQVTEVCITIANRYFPRTQTDRRTIQISVPADYHDWNWYAFCRAWDPKRELFRLNITADRLRELQQQLAAEAQHLDPIARWYSLVQFISVEQKRHLKGKALLAQWLYAMEMMLRLFYEDVTGERLPPPDDDYHRWKERFYGEGVPERELEFLEYLANQYHLNPRPKLILVVEGEGEFEQFPRIAEAMGYPFERVGIRLELLGGVGEFTGKKEEREWGGRLARFIDYHHRLQTIVYVVLDNEGGSQEVKEKLLRTRSKYPGSRRYITKEQYVFLWERNFDFDNFSDLELAYAMSEQAGMAWLFSEEEVRCYRENFGKPGFQLEKLFRSKANQELNSVSHLSYVAFAVSGGARWTVQPRYLMAW